MIHASEHKHCGKGGCWHTGLEERGCSILSPHQSPREDVVMGADLLSAPFQRSEMTNSSLSLVLKEGLDQESPSHCRKI